MCSWNAFSFLQYNNSTMSIHFPVREHAKKAVHFSWYKTCFAKIFSSKWSAWALDYINVQDFKIMGKFQKLLISTWSVQLFFHLCLHQHLVLPNFLINGKQLVITQHLSVMLICFPLITRTLSIFKCSLANCVSPLPWNVMFKPVTYFSIVFDFY